MQNSSAHLHPASLKMDMGGGCIFLGLNQPGHEANNSPSNNAVIKNWWSWVSTPKSLWCIQGQLHHSKKSISVTAFRA